MPAATFSFTASSVNSDQRLANNIAGAVQKTGMRTVRNLSIVAAEGRVMVRGLTRSFYERQLVLHAVRQVPGVVEIVDEIDVAPLAPYEAHRVAS